MSVAIERDVLHQAIDKLPENSLIELARFLEFLQFESQRDRWTNKAWRSTKSRFVDEDAATEEQPPFRSVYFPEGILQGYEFSPEFIADARKELWAGFGKRSR